MRFKFAFVGLLGCATNPTTPTPTPAPQPTPPAMALVALANQSAGPTDGMSLRLKIVSIDLAGDIDATGASIGASPLWLDPECQGDEADCNVDGMTEPVDGPRVTQYVQLAGASADVNAQLAASQVAVTAGTYNYARIGLCSPFADQLVPSTPTVMWQGPGMGGEQSFTPSCASADVALLPALQVNDGDSINLQVGYDLSSAIVTGQPNLDPSACATSIIGTNDIDGSPHCFSTCVDADPSTRVCLDPVGFTAAAL